MVFDLPTSRAIDILSIATLHVICHNCKMLRFWFVSEESLKETADDGRHSRGQNHNWNVVLLGPMVKLDKIGVEFHVVLEDLNTFSKAGLYAIQHVAESIA